MRATKARERPLPCSGARTGHRVLSPQEFSMCFLVGAQPLFPRRGLSSGKCHSPADPSSVSDLGTEAR